MLNIDVVLLPQFLAGGDLAEETVVVFDVLRATSTITSALATGITAIRVFETPALAQSAAEGVSPKPILCGEINTLPPLGFDLGNSPGQFTAAHAGREVYLSTTNGTRALLAARSAAKLFAGSLLNASAVALAAATTNKPIVLLCSGSSGEISIEDTLGAGAVCDSLLKIGGYALEDDTAQMAHRLFLACRDDLRRVLRDAHAGRNIRRVGLDPDIDFAARLNVLDIVGIAASDPSGMIIRKV